MDEYMQKRDLRKILYEEVDIDISMAHEGKIPPSWYADRLQDLRRAVEIGVISEQECLQLSTRFKVAVNSMEQISDKAYTDQCKKQADDSILYCWQGFGNSVVIISRNEDKFFAVVYLNSELLRKKTVAYAEQGIHELQAYADSHGFIPSRVTRRQLQEWCPPNAIPSLEDAFGYAIAELKDCILHSDEECSQS